MGHSQNAQYLFKGRHAWLNGATAISKKRPCTGLLEVGFQCYAPMRRSQLTDVMPG